jgi:hypothetical protein
MSDSLKKNRSQIKVPNVCLHMCRLTFCLLFVIMFNHTISTKQIDFIKNRSAKGGHTVKPRYKQGEGLYSSNEVGKALHWGIAPLTQGCFRSGPSPSMTPEVNLSNWKNRNARWQLPQSSNISIFHFVWLEISYKMCKISELNVIILVSKVYFASLSE